MLEEFRELDDRELGDFNCIFLQAQIKRKKNIKFYNGECKIGVNGVSGWIARLK